MDSTMNFKQVFVLTIEWTRLTITKKSDASDSETIINAYKISLCSLIRQFFPKKEL